MVVQATVGLVNVTTADWTEEVEFDFRESIARNMTAICGTTANQNCTAEDVVILNVTYVEVGSRRVQHNQLNIRYEIRVMSNVAQEAVIIVDNFAFSQEFIDDLRESGLHVVSVKTIMKAIATPVPRPPQSEKDKFDLLLVILIALSVVMLLIGCFVLWFLHRHSEPSPSSSLEYASSMKKEFSITAMLSEEISSDLTSERLLFGSMRLAPSFIHELIGTLLGLILLNTFVLSGFQLHCRLSSLRRS